MGAKMRPFIKLIVAFLCFLLILAAPNWDIKCDGDGCDMPKKKSGSIDDVRKLEIKKK